MTSIEIPARGAQVRLTPRGSATQALVIGDLDWKTSAAVRTAIERALPTPRLIVDLRRVRHLDSFGTGSLIKLSLRCSHEATALALVSDDDLACRALQGVGLSRVVAVLSGDDEVERWLRD